MALYPPILQSSMPPIAVGSGNVLSVTINYDVSNLMSLNEATGIEVKLNDAQTHQNMLETSASKNQITNLNKENKTLNISLSLPLVAGNLYKIQARFYKKNGESITYSEWSNVMVFKAISFCSATIKNEGSRAFPSFKSKYKIEKTTRPIFYGMYTTSKINSETLKEYQFSLYDFDNQLIESSGWIQYLNKNLSSNDIETNEETISFSNSHQFLTKLYNSILEEQIQKYYVIYETKSVNGYYTASAPYYFQIFEEATNDFADMILSCEPDIDKGCIDIYLKKKEGCNVAFPVGKYVVTRASIKDNYKTWEDLFICTRMDEDVSNTLDNNSQFLCADYAIESGVSYKYAIQLIVDSSIRISEKMSDAVSLDFDYAYLYNQDVQLQLKFNTKISSFKNTVQVSKQDTLGSKYPTIVRNGMSYYKEFPLTGTISIHMDDKNTFFKVSDEGYLYKNQLVIPASVCFENNSRNDVIHKSPNLTTSLSSENFLIERIFREKVEEFLNDGEPKLFKSPSEGNIIVSLMNVSLTPNQQLGRMIYDFSATAYEIAECNLKNLDFYNIIKIEGNTDINAKQPYYIVGQLSGIFNGIYNKQRDTEKPLVTVSTSPDNFINLIRDQVFLPVGSGYYHELKNIKNITIEQFPKVDYSAQLSELYKQLQHSFNEKEYNQLQQEYNTLNELQNAINSEPNFTNIPIIIDGQEIYINKNKKYNITNSISSLFLKYTSPIIINFVAEVEHVSKPANELDMTQVVRLCGQSAGIFSNNPMDKNQYPYSDIDHGTLDITQVLFNNIKSQVERANIAVGEFDASQRFEWDEEKRAWVSYNKNKTSYYQLEILTYALIDIEVEPGTKIYFKASDTSVAQNIFIGKTGSYQFNNIDPKSTISFKEPSHAIVNFIVDISQSKQNIVIKDENGVNINESRGL